jgi:hypothetical protein
MGWIQLTRDSVKWKAHVVLQKLGRRTSDASDLFLRGGGLGSQPGAPTALPETLRCFPQLFQANIGIAYYMRPQCSHRRTYQLIARCQDATCSMS